MMNEAAFPWEMYLHRLSLSSAPDVSVFGLRALVRSQSFAIAFENFDVLAETPIRLAQADIVTKVLTGGRGGYCYELNGLLGAALIAAGFPTRPALARVTYRRSEPGPKSHLVFIVTVEGRDWLVDAGFGGPGLVEPAPFEPGEFTQNGVRFRLRAELEGELHLQRRIDGEWSGLYRVSNERVLPIDIEVANHFVSTWERSPFRTMFMCALPREGGGLLTLHGTDRVEMNSDLMPMERTPLHSHTDLQAVLRTDFRVDLPSAVAEKVWEKVA